MLHDGGAGTQRGRESFDRRAWGDAFAELSAADREVPLEPEDLGRRATAAYLLGRDEDSLELWERAHQEQLSAGDVAAAARCAGWIVFVLVNGARPAAVSSNPLNAKAGLEKWLPGNLLLIRHQDGSTSFYTHMLKNGVVPQEGDYVERGDVIIVVGNTGTSTGAHLHYHLTSTGDTENDSYGGSMPIEFERLGAGGLFWDAPQKCNWYMSTNG